jgi:hypothetical protein
MPWTRGVEGVGFPGVTSHGPARRLLQAREITSNDPAMLQLPRPLGLLKPLSVHVFEATEGEPVSRLLGTDGESGVMEALAFSLACLHSSRISVTKERVTQRVIASADQRVGALEAQGHAEASNTREFLSALVSILETEGERRSVTIYPLSLRQLRITSSSVAASYIRDLVMADPLVTAASIAAQLRLLALKRGTAPTAVDRFSRAYLEASEESEHLLNAWQALLILRVGCNHLARDASSPFGAMIIDVARELVEEVLERPAS